MVTDISIELEYNTIKSWIDAPPADATFGGVLVVSLLNTEGSIRSVRFLPLYWNTDRRAGTVAPLLQGFDITGTRTDDDFVTVLRTGVLDTGRDIAIRAEVEFDTTISALLESLSAAALLKEFSLAFLDKSMCRHLGESNDYYYLEAGQYYTAPSTAPITPSTVASRSVVTPDSRRIRFRRALTFIKTNDSELPSVRPYWTLSASPIPEPILVEGDNTSGAIAYMLTPSCPPYWKPKAQFLEVTGQLLVSSRASAEELEEEKKKRNRERLLWIIALIIFLLTLVLSKGGIQLG